MSLFEPAFDCQAPCLALPRNAQGKCFNLSVLVHGAALDDVPGPGIFTAESHRPLVGLSVKEGDAMTDTGRWSKDKGQWGFREALVLQVSADDEMSLTVYAASACSSSAAAGATSGSAEGGKDGQRAVAEWRFGVSQVLARLRMEERAGDGLVYATPAIGFDVLPIGSSAGAEPSGRVFLSFETKTPWAVYRDEDETLPSLLNSDLLWEGPTSWNKRRGRGQTTGVVV